MSERNAVGGGALPREPVEEWWHPCGCFDYVALRWGSAGYSRGMCAEHQRNPEGQPPVPDIRPALLVYPESESTDAR